MKNARLLLSLCTILLLFAAAPALPQSPVRAEEIVTGKPFRVSIDIPGSPDKLNGYMILPNTGTNPAILFVQGMNCKAEQTFDKLTYFASKGYVVLAVDYATHPDGPSPDLVQALKYLKNCKYVRKNRVSIVGFSQGARYGLYVAEFEPVRAVVAISGRYMIDGVKIKTPGESPISCVDKINCPVLLIHGTEDPAVPFQNSLEMEKALKKANKKVTFKVIQTNNHWPGGDQTLMDAVQFIGL